MCGPCFPVKPFLLVDDGDILALISEMFSEKG